MFLQPPKALAWIYPDIVCNVKTADKKLFLTFDDGPTPGITGKVLDLLKHHQVKATFFCLGCMVEYAPELFRRIMVDGHAVGNHGYHHIDGWKTSNEEYFKDVERADGIISSPLFRPPYGHLKWSQLMLLKKKYNIILWDVMSYDFKMAEPATCIKTLTKKATRGSILVFHDTKKAENNMLASLEFTIRHFKNHGFRFDTLSNVL